MLESMVNLNCPSPALSRSAMDTAGGEPGVWVPLRILRQLELPFPAYQRLISSLRRQVGTAPGEDPLLAELTESSAAALREALVRRALDEALAAHDQLLGQVVELAAARPEVAGVLWQRYGDLLGQLTIQVHERVIPREGETADFGGAERAADGALCLRIAGILEHAASHPWEVPFWLPVMEQQLVQHGALAWHQRMATDPAAAGPCLDLFLRLSQLLDPLPEWVEKACRNAMTAVIEQLPAPGAMGERDLGLLIERVSRLPVAPKQRQAFEAALLRARFSLELLQQGRGTGGRPAAAGLEVLEAEWLEEEEGLGAAASLPPLQLVALAVDQDAGPEVFSLEPYLDGDGEGAAAALEGFLQPWQGSDRPACHPITSLLDSLESQGLPLGDGALMVLHRAAALWQKRLAPQILPLPMVDWGAGGLVVELDPLELTVLRHAGAAAEALEEALAELRRRHHDAGFWDAEAADPLPAMPDALEALRRFEAQAGFYATTHAPLESLRQWARPALQALLRAQVWSSDAATAALWLPWALAGMGTTAREGALRQPPTAASLLERLGGEEVVVVGDGTAAIQEAHRAGRLFHGGVFGLRCLEAPQSRHPHRPAAGFEHSLEALGAAVEQLYRERPFTVLLAGGGAYRLPLVQAIHSRFGVLAVAAPLVRLLEGNCVVGL
jgi:phosphoglycolate phosphatase-like HAD superfamily hydrolase